MEDTDLYKQNKFGLKTINEQGRIFKHEIDGEHLEYGTDIIADVFVKALLRWTAYQAIIHFSRKILYLSYEIFICCQ